MTESDAEKIQQQAKQPEVPTPDQKQEIKAAAVKTAPVKSSRKTAAKKTTSAAKKTTKAVKEEKASAAVNLAAPVACALGGLAILRAVTRRGFPGPGWGE